MKSFHLLALPILLLSTLCFDTNQSTVEIQYQYFNLASSVDRREAIEKRFADAGISGTRVAAVPGAELDLTTLAKTRLYNADAFNKIRGRNAKPGEVGYHFSFLHYLSDAALNPTKLIVHFDDDAVFSPTLDSDFRNALKRAPSDWDILFLGCNYNRMVGKDGHIFGFPGYEPREGGDYNLCPDDSVTPITNSPWMKLQERCVAGSYALVVRSSAAKELLPQMLQMTAESDMAIKYAFDKMKVYCLKPALVDVAPVLSTIK